MSGWQPIETAPLEVDVLTYGSWGVVTACKLPVSRKWITGFEDVLDKSGVTYSFSPTHWMPLPEPPKE